MKIKMLLKLKEGVEGNMVDKIVELENGKSYVILEETLLNNNKYYLGLKLNKNEEPTNNYLFFEELVESNNTYLTSIVDDNVKSVLLTSFTMNFLEKVYDEI